MAEISGVPEVLARIDTLIRTLTTETRVFDKTYRNDEILEVLNELRDGLVDQVPTWAEVSISEVLADRDRARRVAVRLEQELAETQEWLDAYRAVHGAAPTYQYGAGLLVDDDPVDVFEVQKGPWSEPREVDEGFYLMCQAVGPWVPVSAQKRCES